MACSSAVFAPVVVAATAKVVDLCSIPPRRMRTVPVCVPVATDADP